MIIVLNAQLVILLNNVINEKEGYVINGKNCYLKCSDENCRFCSLVENQEVCTECLDQYELDGVKCKPKTNYNFYFCNFKFNFILIFIIYGILIL